MPSYRFEEPWIAVDDDSARALADRLQTGIDSQHSFAGLPVTTLGRCLASDDVLYQVGNRFVMMHLTWGAGDEPPPDPPQATYYDSFLAWEKDPYRAY